MSMLMKRVVISGINQGLPGSPHIPVLGDSHPLALFVTLNSSARHYWALNLNPKRRATT